MSTTGETKQIVDSYINSLQRSCEKRTQNPQLISTVYSELLKIEKLQGMEPDQIPSFIDAVINMNFHYAGSKYNQGKRMESDKPNFYDYEYDIPEDDDEEPTLDTEKLYKVVDDAFDECEQQDCWYYRILFKKYYFQNYTYMDIQKATNIPKQSVWNAVKRGYDILNDHINKKYGSKDKLYEYLKQ